VRALVTGARGFCGAHLVRYLERQTVEVHTLAARPGAGDATYLTEPDDPVAIARAIERARPDWIFHLAGVQAADDVATYYRINTLYAVHVIEAAARVGLGDRPILLIGSAAEHGFIEPDRLPVDEQHPAHPLTHYGTSKLAQTLMAQTMARAGAPIVIARPSNIIGPGMRAGAVQAFAQQAAEIARGGRPAVIEVGNLDSIRDFIDVEDVVALFVRLIQEPAARGRVSNVCTGRGTRMAEVLDRLIRIAGIPVQIRPVAARQKDVDVPAYVGSTETLRRLLGDITFTALDVTLAKIYGDVAAAVSSA